MPGNLYISSQNFAGGPPIFQNADQVPYDNATSGLAATHVQDAIDEVEGRVDLAESAITALQTDAHTHANKAVLDAITAAGSGIIISAGERTAIGVNSAHVILTNNPHGVTAIQASYDNTTSGLIATNVQAAIDETEGRVDLVERNNHVIVKTKSDFPAPVAGVITLVANTLYEINGSVDIGTDRIEFGANVRITGRHRAVDKLIYQGTGNALTWLNVSSRIVDLNLQAPNGTLLSFTGTGTEAFFLQGCSIVNTKTVGTVTAVGTFICDIISIISATTNGLLLTGTNGKLKINDSLVKNVAGTGIDLGTSVWDIIVLRDIEFEVNATQTGVSGAASNANLATTSTSKASLINNFFSGLGTYVNTIVRTDTKWDFQLNSGVPDSPVFPDGYVKGASTKYVSVSSVTIGTAGEQSAVKSSDDEFDIFWSGLLAADITVSGKGGLDTGTETASTWYAIHVIADSGNQNATDVVLSLSATTPTLPAGYDKSRRVGWVRNNTSSDFLKFDQFGGTRNKKYIYDEITTALQVLSSGNATIFTTVSLSSFVPPTSRAVFLFAEFDNTGAANDVGIRPVGSVVARDDTLQNIQLGTATAAGFRSIRELATDASQQIEYEVTSAGDSLDLSVKAFVDEI